MTRNCTRAAQHGLSRRTRRPPHHLQRVDPQAVEVQPAAAQNPDADDLEDDTPHRRRDRNHRAEWCDGGRASASEPTISMWSCPDMRPHQDRHQHQPRAVRARHQERPDSQLGRLGSGCPPSADGGGAVTRLAAKASRARAARDADRRSERRPAAPRPAATATAIGRRARRDRAERTEERPARPLAGARARPRRASPSPG